MTHSPNYHCGELSADTEDFCCLETPNNVAANRKHPFPDTHPALQLPPGVLDPYQLLYLRRDAKKHEIRNAYKRLSLLHHPARRNGNESQFIAIAAAYETLSCHETRKKLDEVLFANHQLNIVEHSSEHQLRTADQSLLSQDHQGTEEGDTVVSFTQIADNNLLTKNEHNVTSTADFCSVCGMNSDHDGHLHHIRNPMKHNVSNVANGLGSPLKSTTSPSAASFVPTLLNPTSSSASTTNDDVRHYSKVATDRLFGGPLQLMYRARRWQPFTDPYVLFHCIFGSSLGRKSIRSPNDYNTQTDWKDPIVRTRISHSHFNRSIHQTETLSDGTIVNKDSKVSHYDYRSFIRTVTRFQDPYTGHTRTTVHVISRDLLESEQDGDQHNDAKHSICYQAIVNLLTVSHTKPVTKNTICCIDNDQAIEATEGMEDDDDDDGWFLSSTSCPLLFMPSCCVEQ